MAEEKPRILQNSRDILLSLSIIVVIMVLLVGFTGMCSYNRGEPENGPVREVDAQEFYELEAKTATFPLRDPGNAPGWIPNSARRVDIGGNTSPTVGWVIDDDYYVQLSQTVASVAEIAEFYEREADREYEISGDFGTRTVIVYPAQADDDRDYYVLDDADVRLVASGAAQQEHYTDVFTRTLEAPVLNASASTAATTTES